MAAALLSPAMAFAQSAPAAPPPSEPGAAPSPPVAVAPQPRPPAPWREGVMALPFVGLNSLQGDSGQNFGVGFRVGALVGSRFSEYFSLNFQATLDLLNAKDQRGTDFTAQTTARTVDAGIAPLVHVPLSQYPLEIVAGPILGAFYEWGSTSIVGLAGGASVDNWAWGWSVGGNAGVLYRVRDNVRLGALLAFTSRIPERSCISPPGQDSMCMTTGLTSAKVVGFGVAALF